MKSPTERLVIGLDSSTQSAKAIAWDRTGHMVAEGRAPIPLSNPGLGRFEQDPEDWWTACRAALQACTKQIDAGAVDALAISNQRETVAFLDAEGRALHPALTWLDERTRAEVAEVSELIGPETVHRITGRYPDVILCLYRFLWIKKHRPDVWERTACFADVQAFLVRRLAGGDWRTGWISADPFGLFDVEAKRWSPVILEALDLDETRLARAEPPGTELGRVNAAAAAETGLREGLPIIAAGGDGQCAGLGTNCTTSERCYINLGTAVVSGVWSRDYQGRSRLAHRDRRAGRGLHFRELPPLRRLPGELVRRPVREEGPRRRARLRAARAGGAGAAGRQPGADGAALLVRRHGPALGFRRPRRARRAERQPQAGARLPRPDRGDHAAPGDADRGPGTRLPA